MQQQSNTTPSSYVQHMLRGCGVGLLLHAARCCTQERLVKLTWCFCNGMVKLKLHCQMASRACVPPQGKCLWEWPEMQPQPAERS